MQVTDIDKKIDEAIYYLEIAVDRVEREADSFELFPREVSLSDDAPNYEKAVFELHELIQSLRNIRNAHRLFKINDAMKVAMFSSFLNNDETKPIIVTETYTVTDCDTLEGIGIKLNVDWRKIAEFNSLDSMDLTAGNDIQIPREFDPKLILDFNKSQNPVFDLPDGERVLGKDLPNELEEDSTGDLKVLQYRETFKQGMNNIVNTDVGSLPFNPNFGFDNWVGDDIPSDVRDEWMRSKSQESFLRDARVFEVPGDEIEITRSGESLSIEMRIYPIQGLDFETIVGETKFV